MPAEKRRSGHAAGPAGEGIVASGPRRNCAAPLVGPFRAACGQRHHEHLDPSLGEIAREASEELLRFDGKLFETLRLLTTALGRLTREFLAGRRARYVSPLTLYLTCSLVYFLVVAVALPVEQAVARSERGRTAVTRRPKSVIEAERVSPDSVARVLEAQGARRGGVAEVLFSHAAHVQRDRVGFARRMRETVPKVFFVFVPLFGWIVSRVYRDRGRYPAHLLFALHLFAFGFLSSTVAEVVGLLPRMSLVAGWALMALWAWYGVRALREVYGGTAAATIGRATVISLLGFVGFVLVGIVGTAIVFLSF